MSSYPYLLICFGWLCLTAKAAPPLAPTPVQGKARTALVVGNAKYEASAGPLRNTANDARAMASTLRSLSFAVIEKHNVTRDQLLKAVMEFRATLNGAEVGLFYYAGHGLAIGGSNYLIPLKSGYVPDGADDITLRLLAETRLFNVEQAVADMSSAGAKCNLVILDACRTTSMARTGRTRDVAEAGGLREMKPPAGSLIAFATDAGQTALDGDGSNGLYTEELLRHLQTPGITIEQVFKRTRAGVLSRSEGGQIPAEYSRLVGDDIYLAGPASLEPVAPVVPAAEMKAQTSAEELPTKAQITHFAKTGNAEACADALIQTAKVRGPGSYAAEPLTDLLQQVKDSLKDEALPVPALESTVATCTHVLRAIGECLPPDHEQFSPLTAKAHNRRGDALVRLQRAEEAIPDFDIARVLTPEDSYILYNRGQAHLALKNVEAAKADFAQASSSKFNQPGARKLALEALKSLE